MQKKWLIHFSGDDYWFSNPHSRHHITREFNREYNVLWVNPVGSRFPSMKKKGFRARIFRKLKSLSRKLEKVDDHFYVVMLFSLPVFRNGIIQNLNNRMVKFQLKLVCKKLGIKDALLLYTSPVHSDTLRMIPYRAAIYYYSDQYTEYREFDERTKKFTELQDRKLFTGCDLIMCASQKIYDNLVTKTDRKVVYFPHQVNYAFFEAKAGLAVPSDMTGIRKPVIGYYGSLSDSNDWEVIRYAAEQRPSYSFVFIGRKDIHDTGLEHFPNVFFLGKKSFEEIPQYGYQFDVALMFWIRRPWIVNCSPLKLKEYLSMGIPVVSTFIEEVKQQYDGIVLTSADKEEFLVNIDRAMDPVYRQELISSGIERVKNDSWYNAVRVVKSELLLDSS